MAPRSLKISITLFTANAKKSNTVSTVPLIAPMMPRTRLDSLKRVMKKLITFVNGPAISSAKVTIVIPNPTIAPTTKPIGESIAGKIISNGPNAAATPAAISANFFVSGDSLVIACIKPTKPSSISFTTGIKSCAKAAPASFRLSSAVLNLPAAVWLRRSIAPAAKPPSVANPFKVALNCSTLTAPAPSLSAGKPVASAKAVKIGMPRSASWFKFSSSTLPLALTLAKMAAISSIGWPLVAAMSPRNCS